MVLGGSHQRVVAWLVAISVILSIGMASCSTTDRNSPQAGRSSPPMIRPASFREVADPASAPGDANAPSAGVRKGKELYATLGCAGCHMVNGQGGQVGPDLSNEGNAGHSRPWLKTQIRDPKSHNSQTTMPAYDKLSEPQVNDLVDYLESLKKRQARAGVVGRVPSVAGAQPAASVGTASLVTTGGKLWGQTCRQCHNLRPPSEYSDAQWAVAVHHMRVRVPLTGQEQRDILAFLQASN